MTKTIEVSWSNVLGICLVILIIVFMSLTIILTIVSSTSQDKACREIGFDKFSGYSKEECVSNVDYARVNMKCGFFGNCKATILKETG